MMRAIALTIVLLWPLAASAQTRYYTPQPPRPYWDHSDVERRARQIETYRLQREQAEDLRRLRNDLEDRAHRETMEQFRERLRKQED